MSFEQLSKTIPPLPEQSSANLGQNIIAGLRTILGDNVDGECHLFDRPLVTEQCWQKKKICIIGPK